MVKVSEKNGFQNVQETERQLFQIGGPGGPGRGNTRKKQERSEAVEEMKALLLDDNVDLTSAKALAPVGRVLYYEIASENSKLSNDSKKLYLTWLGKMFEIKDREKIKDSLPSPEDLNRFSGLLSVKRLVDVLSIELDVEPFELIKTLDSICRGCEKLKAAVKDFNSSG